MEEKRWHNIFLLTCSFTPSIKIIKKFGTWREKRRTRKPKMGRRTEVLISDFVTNIHLGRLWFKNGVSVGFAKFENLDGQIFLWFEFIIILSFPSEIQSLVPDNSWIAEKWNPESQKFPDRSKGAQLSQYIPNVSSQKPEGFPDSSVPTSWKFRWNTSKLSGCWLARWQNTLASEDQISENILRYLVLCHSDLKVTLTVPRNLNPHFYGKFTELNRCRLN